MAIDDVTPRVATNGIGARPSGALTGLFDQLPESSRELFHDRMTEQPVVAGEVVFRSGDPGDALYLVRSGLVDIVAEGEDGRERLSTLGPGELFGEQALLTGRPRSATASAQTDALLWRLDHTDFVHQLSVDPALAKVVAEELSRRVISISRSGRGARRGHTVLIHATEPALAASMQAALAAACARHLAEDPLVLAAGRESDWRDTAASGATVVPADDIVGIAVRGVRSYPLVFILTSGATSVPEAFAGADWCFVLGAAAPAERTHARPARAFAGVPDDDGVAAVAREICGRRIGLALGAGGTRGWAHAGVLEVIERERLPVDFVSGASAGALAGALFVAGMPADAMMQMSEIARDVGSAILRTYRPSFAAILSGRPFVQYLKDKIGDDVQIEDLPMPLIISTTDLDTRKSVHLTEGPLAEAVVASSAVNGIFPPVRYGDRRLVDGAASDPVPTGVLRRAGADIVVAVNVMNIGRGASGLYTPRLRIPMPGMIDNLLIGLDTVITQTAVLSCKLADVIVEPDDAGASWYEVMPSGKYAASGRRAMEAAVPAIRALLAGESAGSTSAGPERIRQVAAT